MTEIIDIKTKKPLKPVPVSKEVLRLYNFGKDIDDVIVHHLELGMSSDEGIVVLGHRLAELMRLIEHKPDMLLLLIDLIKKNSGMKK